MKTWRDISKETKIKKYNICVKKDKNIKKGKNLKKSNYKCGEKKLRDKFDVYKWMNINFVQCFPGLKLIIATGIWRYKENIY